MNILAIDPGLSCGWCILRLPQTGFFINSGVWDLHGNRFEGAGMRILRLRGCLSQIARDAGPFELVAFEEVRRHLGVDAAHMYGAITHEIMAWCEQNTIPYRGIPVATVKKRATGKGNANKEKMLAAAQKQWPCHVFADDNEADARWIAVCAAVGVDGFGRERAGLQTGVGT